MENELPSQVSEWMRKRFKGNKVWVATDRQGRLVRDKDKVLIKYQLDQPYKYWVHADKIEDLNAKDPDKKPDTPAATPPKKPPRKDVNAPRTVPDKPSDDKPTIHVYTDGASSGNPGPAGIGVFMRYGPHERKISQYLGPATNNVAELMAVKIALESIKRKDMAVRIYTDSSYVHGLLSSGWKAQKNKALVSEIRELCRGFQDLKLVKVKGHDGIEGNEKADKLATSAIKDHAR